jgi:hypothetical protein
MWYGKLNHTKMPKQCAVYGPVTLLRSGTRLPVGISSRSVSAPGRYQLPVGISSRSVSAPGRYQLPGRNTSPIKDQTPVQTVSRLAIRLP